MALYQIVAAQPASQPASEGVLRVRFATGEERLFDVRPFLRSDFFRRLADPAYFAQVRVQNGTVTWPDGHDFDAGTVFAQSADAADQQLA